MGPGIQLVLALQEFNNADVDDQERHRLLDACRSLQPAKGSYLETDFVTNLLATVVDYQMHTTAVEKAMSYFLQHHADEIRTFEDLKKLLDRYPDDKEGNTAAATHLWGYRFWTRLAQLRGLVNYFQSVGVTNQDELTKWARDARFSDFQGKVKGLGPAVFQWLVMRQGVETIKPDVHVMRFVERSVGRRVSETEAVAELERVATALGLRAYELDWAIWESGRDRRSV